MHIGSDWLIAKKYANIPYLVPPEHFLDIPLKAAHTVHSVSIANFFFFILFILFFLIHYSNIYYRPVLCMNPNKVEDLIDNARSRAECTCNHCRMLFIEAISVISEYPQDCSAIHRCYNYGTDARLQNCMLCAVGRHMSHRMRVLTRW